MLMIRFQRIGRKNDAAFRIVLLEKERSAKSGHITEQLGTYNPHSKSFTLNQERVKEWLSKGAQPTDTVRNFLITKGIIEGKKVNVLPKRLLEKKPEPAPEAPSLSKEVETSEPAVSEAPEQPVEETTTAA